MAEQFRSVTINFAPVKVAGVAGLPLLVVVGVIALVLLEARWLLLCGIIGGGMLGALLIHVHRPLRVCPGGSLLGAGRHAGRPKH